MFAAGKAVSGAEATDAQFNYVTMLLHGDGTNGAQNNTFLDSSTNNFTITRNGNTTQGTFTPYGANWSMYQSDASSAYLGFTTSVGTSFQFAGDFTIEGWVYYNSSSGDASLYVISDNTNYLALNISMSAGNYNIYLNSGSPTSSFSHGISVGVWTHVAMVRSGSTVTLYTNGVSKGTITNSSTLGYSAPAINRTGGGVSGIDRYISNIRVVKSAVYTSAFTPSTTPLTAIANTSLLTCQSNRFVDNSSNAYTPTITGSPSVQRFSPFSPLSSYSTSGIGGSGYFDGSDSLSISSANTVLPTGTQDFSVELSVYWQTQSGSYPQIISNPTTSGFQIYYDVSAGALAVGIFNVANVITYTIAQSDLAGVWTHIAVTRSSTTFRLFVNGVLRANGTNVISFASPTTQYIASDGSRPYTGYITDVRTCLGSIPTSYQTSSTTNGTSIFTSPTAPVTTSSQGAANTALLLSYTNAAILDNAMMNDLETVGNAQISTSVKKYGTGSLAFDGTGDYLIPNSASSNLVLGLGSGDFTVEFWVYFNSGLGSDIVLYDGRPLSTNGAYPTLYVNSSSQLSYVVSSSDRITSASAFSTSTWYHIAVARSGTSTKMFVNGTQVGSTYTDSTNYLSASRRPTIGINGFNETAAALNGYIDDLRISKVARYTANFTAPIAAFADKG